MSRTIGGSISVGISLASGDNPVSITGTINTGAGNYALYGPGGTPWNVTNSGVITIANANPASNAVTLDNGYLLNTGTIGVTNTASTFGSAIAMGGGAGSTAAGTVVNEGTISSDVTGVFAPAALLESGGTFNNSFSASVQGAVSGVGVRNITENGQGEAIFNSGFISGSGADVGYGVAATSGFISNGLISAGVGAQISNWHYGVDLSGPGTVTNAGTISDQIGVLMSSGGYLFNAPFAHITGTDGAAVEIFGDGTVVNGGIISSSAPGQDAIELNGGLLIIDPGAQFNGVVDGGGGVMQVTGDVIVTGVGTTFQTFNEIDFLPGIFAEVTGSAAGFNGMTIAGFFTGSTLELTGASDTISGFNDGTLSLAGSDPISLVMGTGFAGSDYSAVQVSGNTDITVSCFAAGTRILTNAGEVPVEALRPRMRVVSVLHHGLAPVRWIGHQHVDCARRPEAWPVRIAADALGAGTPHRDLWLSPDHAVLLDGVLVPVRCLINGMTIAQVACTTVSYYHVELGVHGLLMADGLAAESYLDTGNRRLFAGGHAAPAIPVPSRVR